MNYYYCSSCDKKIDLNYKMSHLKSAVHVNTEWTVINKYKIMNLELCEVNNILINFVVKYDKKFVFFEIVCKWKLVFDNDISIDVKSKVMYRIPVLRFNLEKYLEN